MADTHSFNKNIGESLNLLYDNSATFNISIDLVQRLAQHLKLDTFVDKDAYTHVTTTKSDLNFKRLSIAGSLILIDIDFLDDTTILKVSLSSANHPEESQTDETKKKHSTITSRKAIEEGKSFSLTLSKPSDLSFLSKSAESVLLQNLTSSTKRLNQFPANLKYLSSLDSSSLPQLDLFIYLDKISSILYAVEELEVESQNLGDSWDAPYATATGKVLANDSQTGQLGMFLKYWSDYRYINHDNNGGSSATYFGNEYKILLRISAVGEDEDIHQDQDYQNSLLKDDWEINGKTYSFNFETEGNNFSPSLTNKFRLHLDLNHPVVLPVSIIEFLDIADVQIVQPSIRQFSEEEANKDVYQSLTSYKDIQFTSQTGSIQIKQDFPQEYTTVGSITLKKLNSIGSITSVLRNYLVFDNLIKSLTKLATSSIEAYSIENEVEAVSKKTLKESLNITGGIGDEELLGLSLSAENPLLSSIKSIKPVEVDLDTFMDTEVEPEPRENLEDDIQSDLPSNGNAAGAKSILQLTVEDIDLSTLDIIVSVAYSGFDEGKNAKTEFDSKFKISNGVIQSIGSGEDVSMTRESSTEKFIRALNVTEDVTKSIQSVL